MWGSRSKRTTPLLPLTQRPEAILCTWRKRPMSTNPRAQPSPSLNPRGEDTEEPHQ